MTFYLSKRSDRDRDRDLVKSNPSSQYQGYDPGVTIPIAHDRSGVVFYIARFSEVALAISDCHDLHGEVWEIRQHHQKERHKICQLAKF